MSEQSGVTLEPHQVHASDFVTQYANLAGAVQASMNETRTKKHDIRKAAWQYQVAFSLNALLRAKIQPMQVGALLDDISAIPYAQASSGIAYVGLYGAAGYHTPAIVLNQMSNVYARQQLKNAGHNNQFTIRAANQPLPQHEVQGIATSKTVTRPSLAAHAVHLF